MYTKWIRGKSKKEIQCGKRGNCGRIREGKRNAKEVERSEKEKEEK